MSDFMFLWHLRRWQGLELWSHVLDEVCGKAGDVIHAVPADDVLSWGHAKSRRTIFAAVCRVRVRLILPTVRKDTVAVRMTVDWPPEVAGLRTLSLSRCAECHTLTGRRRPRAVLRAAPEQVAA